MYLKRLELLGFKSFPDKTVIKLTPGVTAVVGPNGCGKSNILDAIRWVLGEQKVSLLRGSKMEEIIFNGTRDLKPLGMAEVTLVIQNNKGILPTEYSEVQITRRLFRSGESEYLLNKVPCRLKDITELLMDTGIGAHIYAMIQQDMVDAILSDRTDDRRFLFEEAAGISKYKSRKNAAVRKLEATEQDLIRLKDIIAEINTQVNSLRRQMKKAERYQQYSEELKSWDVFLSKNSLDELIEERREAIGKKDTLVDIRVRHDTEIDTLSAELENQRKSMTDLDRSLTEISNQVFEKSEQAHGIETEINVTLERRNNARRLMKKNQTDIEAYRRRRELLAEQVDEVNSELEMVEKELLTIDSEVSVGETTLTAADERVLDARRLRDELNQRLMSLEGRLSAEKTDDSNLKEQESEIKPRIVQLDEQLTVSAERKKILQNSQESRKGNLSELDHKIKEISDKKLSLSGEADNLENEIDDLSGKVFDISASLEAAEARHHLLNEMITQYEGYSSGVAPLLELRERWPGIIDTVADSFKPRAGYELAIEAALGEMAGFVICRDRNTAEQAIAFLEIEKKGKAGFMILDTAREADTTRPDIQNDGFIGWADDLIDYPENMSSLAGMLLARMAVIKPGTASQILEQLPPFFSAVSTNGTAYKNRVVVTGGSKDEISLFGRKEKITEEERAIDRMTSDLKALKESKNRTTARLGAIHSELSEIAGSLKGLFEEHSDLQKEFASGEFEFEGLNRDIVRLESERNALSEKLEALKSRQYNLNLNYDQLAREKEELLKTATSSDSRIGELEKESEAAADRASRLQIRKVEQRSLKEQHESRRRHIRELIQEIDNGIKTKSIEIITAEEDISQVDERITVLERELKNTFEARTQVSAEQTRLRQNQAEYQSSIADFEKRIKALRQERDEAGIQIHQAEIRLTEIESDVRAIRTKIRDEYELDLDESESEIPDMSIPVEQRPARMRELRETIKNYGAVNLLALEEYNSASERQEFLSTQINDLMQAKNTLQTTITKINTTARNLFLETFDKVRENFQKVFAELFAGGDCDIHLVSEDDPLESPIEITARPRGKKLLSITQMSGGERALTAISLLFAIYLVKPSPFCILDEIDAPLDDANIHRFLKIIKTFSDQTQFIIITHNKITMEAADNMYGITMEQPGISKVVSVRFQEDSDEGVVDTSLDKTEYSSDADDIEIPDAIKERITPKIHLEPKFNKESN